MSGNAQSGAEEIVIRLDPPRAVGRVGLRLARRSFGDYPRLLSVETAAPDGTMREVYRGDMLMPLGLAIARDGGYPSIDIAIPPATAAKLVLRQLGQTRRMFWSIHEIEVWAR